MRLEKVGRDSENVAKTNSPANPHRPSSSLLPSPTEDRVDEARLPDVRPADQRDGDIGVLAAIQQGGVADLAEAEGKGGGGVRRRRKSGE